MTALEISYTDNKNNFKIWFDGNKNCLKHVQMTIIHNKILLRYKKT